MHNWLAYQGFTESFEYCEHCDQRKGSHSYNCDVGPKLEFHTLDETEWYYLNTVTGGISPETIQRSCYTNPTGTEEYLTFHSEDDLTLLKFEDGHIHTPKELYESGNMVNNYHGQRFVFRQIRESWQTYYGLSAPNLIPTALSMITPRQWKSAQALRMVYGKIKA